MSALEGMPLSACQRAAVLDPHEHILVGAGAGSGKTRLLVAFIVRALVDEQLPAERLIAVTFTRKAAAELASRVRNELVNSGRPDLAAALDAATLGTIHSLCRRLLQEHALPAGIDPDFRVLEAEAALLAKAEVSAKSWVHVVEEAPPSLLDVLALRGASLRQQVVPIYDRLRQLGQIAPTIVVDDDGLSAEECAEALRCVVETALAAGRAVGAPSRSLQSDLTTLDDCLACLAAASGGLGRPNLCLTDSLFPTRRTPSFEDHFAPVRRALTVYRRSLAEPALREMVTAINLLLERFHLEYSRYKFDRGFLDFADLELRARALIKESSLDGHRVLLPGSYVLVDEFQDTNEIQCEILESLGAAKLLMVGDERQSIYRFRGADVEVFRRRADLLSAGGKGRGGTHRLDVNYRSRPEILAFVNHVFGHSLFFGERFATLRAPEGAGDGRSDSADPAVEILIADRSAQTGVGTRSLAQRAEAEAIADRVSALVSESRWQARDVVILLPSQTHVALYEEALAAREVAVYVVRGKGYYSRNEVTDTCALLRVILNPHDDLALLTVLRSPLVGLSDDAIYLIGREARRRETRSLWEVISHDWPTMSTADEAALNAFVEWLPGLRGRIGRPGLSRLIDDALSAGAYDRCLLSSPGGIGRFANIRKLMRLADEFEALDGPDLSRFVSVVESMGELSEAEGNAPTLAEEEDVVRVMTVHQAKGLEFPVVVLAGLGGNPYTAPPGDFVIDQKGGAAVFLKGSRRDSYEAIDLCWGPGEQIIADEEARDEEEDQRLLYVAMTRAEELLVLAGARSRDGDLESCRLGRVLKALGLPSFPDGDAAVSIPGARVSVNLHVPAGEPSNAQLGPIPSPGSQPPMSPYSAPTFVSIGGPQTPPRRASFSALAAWLRCPRQFYLERILRAGRIEKPNPVARGDAGPDEWNPLADQDPFDQELETALDRDERADGREVGLLVHALLEQLYLLPEAPPRFELTSLARKTAGERAIEIDSAGLERSLALVGAYWRSPLALKARDENGLSEVPFFFMHDDTLVSGYMDLVTRDRDAWTIVDYKTNGLKGRSTAEVAKGYEIQAAVYALAALRAGAMRVNMSFLFLEEPRQPVSSQYGPADRPLLEAKLSGILTAWAAGNHPPERGEHCAGCAVWALCESWPAVR